MEEAKNKNLTPWLIVGALLVVLMIVASNKNKDNEKITASSAPTTASVPSTSTSAPTTVSAPSTSTGIVMKTPATRKLFVKLMKNQGVCSQPEAGILDCRGREEPVPTFVVVIRRGSAIDSAEGAQVAFENFGQGWEGLRTAGFKRMEISGSSSYYRNVD